MPKKTYTCNCLIKWKIHRKHCTIFVCVMFKVEGIIQCKTFNKYNVRSLINIRPLINIHEYTCYGKKMENS